MTRRIWPYLLLAALCGVLFFWRLGAIPLMGLDEGLYSECSREMLASGDYIVPTCNGGPFYDKPPVAYWLQAASMRAFGVNSFAARLPSAVEELLLVGLTVWLGARLFSRRAGLMAGFALACSLLTAGLARMAILDAAFALAITASLGGFAVAHLKLASMWSYLVFWAGMGLAMMVKGPAGAIVILATVAVFLLIRRDARAFARAMPVIGAAVFLAVAVPWYVLVQHQTGGAFLREFLIHQNIQRALGQDFQHNMPFYFYLPVYLVGFFPWSVFVLAAIGQSRKQVLPTNSVLVSAQCSRCVIPRRHDEESAFGELSAEQIPHCVRNDEPWDLRGTRFPGSTRKHEGGKARNADGIGTALLTIWIGVVLVLFSIFRSKLPAYIFPMLPPSALLVGALWSRAIEAGELVCLRRSALAATIIACAIGAAMVILPSRLEEPIPGLATELIPMAVVLIVGCGAGYVLLALRRPVAAFAALCAGIGGFIALAVCLGLPIAARTNAVPAVAMARRIAERAEPAFAFRLSPPQPQLGFYSRRPVPRVEDPARIPSNKPCLVVAQRDRCADLPSGGRVLGSVGPYFLVRFDPASRM